MFGPESQIFNPGSWVPGLGFWVMGSQSYVLILDYADEYYDYVKHLLKQSFQPLDTRLDYRGLAFIFLCLKWWSDFVKISVWRRYNSYGSSRPEVLCKKVVLRSFTKLTGKNMCQNFTFNKVADLNPASLLKMRLWHMYFQLLLQLCSNGRIIPWLIGTD